MMMVEEALRRVLVVEDDDRVRGALCDYLEELVTGLEVAKQMRARDPSLPVVIVSGYTAEFAWEARALGIPVVSKPVDFGAFARIVEDLARR